MSVRRSIHMSIALLAILVLIRPLDCMAGVFTRKAAACCVKGRCLPSANADDCCKGSVPAGSQLSAPEAPDNSTAVPALVLVHVTGPIAPVFFDFFPDEVHRPPGSPPDSRLNLPLLI